jgi:hypothetical protein
MPRKHPSARDVGGFAVMGVVILAVLYAVYYVVTALLQQVNAPPAEPRDNPPPPSPDPAPAAPCKAPCGGACCDGEGEPRDCAAPFVGSSAGQKVCCDRRRVATHKLTGFKVCCPLGYGPTDGDPPCAADCPVDGQSRCGGPGGVCCENCCGPDGAQAFHCCPPGARCAVSHLDAGIKTCCPEGRSYQRAGDGAWVCCTGDLWPRGEDCAAPCGRSTTSTGTCSASEECVRVTGVDVAQLDADCKAAPADRPCRVVDRSADAAWLCAAAKRPHFREVADFPAAVRTKFDTDFAPAWQVDVDARGVMRGRGVRAGAEPYAVIDDIARGNTANVASKVEADFGEPQLGRWCVSDPPGVRLHVAKCQDTSCSFTDCVYHQADADTANVFYDAATGTCTGLLLSHGGGRAVQWATCSDDGQCQAKASAGGPTTADDCTRAPACNSLAAAGALSDADNFRSSCLEPPPATSPKAPLPAAAGPLLQPDLEYVDIAVDTHNYSNMWHLWVAGKLRDGSGEETVVDNEGFWGTWSAKKRVRRDRYSSLQGWATNGIAGDTRIDGATISWPNAWEPKAERYTFVLDGCNFMGSCYGHVDACNGKDCPPM